MPKTGVGLCHLMGIKPLTVSLYGRVFLATTPPFVSLPFRIVVLNSIVWRSEGGLVGDVDDQAAVVDTQLELRQCFDKYRPLEIENLFSRFAEDTPVSAQGMHAFCNKFGLLGGGRRDLAPMRGRRLSESALGSDLLREHWRIRSALSRFRKSDPSELVGYWNSAHGVGLVRAELRVDPEGRLERVLMPPDLMSAMWLQFADFACSQAQLFRCQRCGKPFQVGTGTGRRRTANFCSDSCKVARSGRDKERQNETVTSAKGRPVTGPSSSTCATLRRACANASGIRSAEPSARRRPSVPAS
jgi:hypothetical protein